MSLDPAAKTLPGISDPGLNSPGFSSTGYPLTREELLIAAKLADHLASQLAELDRRELSIRADMARLLEQEQELTSQSAELSRRLQDAETCQTLQHEIDQTHQLLHAQAEELQESRRRETELSGQLVQERQRWESELEQAQEGWAQQAAQWEGRLTTQIEQAVHVEQQGRLAEFNTLRNTAAVELESARLKIVEERVAFDGELARSRRRLNDEFAHREAGLDQEALRLRELRQQGEELTASLESQRRALLTEQAQWQQSSEQRVQDLEQLLQMRKNDAEQEILRLREQYSIDELLSRQQALQAEQSKLETEREQAITEIERRKSAAQELLIGQRNSLAQLRGELEQDRKELDGARAQHEHAVREWTEMSRTQAQKLAAGLEDIRNEKLAGLDLREKELARREVDHKKRTQLHEQHLERVRGEIKEQRGKLNLQRQQQRIWIEQVETSIRLRMTHLRKFRDLVAAREHGLDAQRQHVLEMEHSATAAESSQFAVLEQLRLDLMSYGTELRDWLAHPLDGRRTPESVAAALSMLMTAFDRRGSELRDLIAGLQGQRDLWHAERVEAEQVIRQLVQQLEMALDELARQQEQESVDHILPPDIDFDKASQAA